MEKERNVMPTNVHHCTICQKVIPTVGLCDDHLAQLQSRQQTGVTTEALDTSWGDTLDIWLERPSSLHHEIGKRPFSSPFIFSMKEKDWLVFTRTYYNNRTETLQKQDDHTVQRRTPRLKDSLAINVVSGEIRRFVNLPKEMVLEDIQGIRSAPYQVELAPFWGNPDVGGVHEKWQEQFYDRPYRINIPKFVMLADFPVYGFVDPLADLSLESLFSCSFSNYRVNFIGFLFSSSQSPEEQRRKLYVSSGRAGKAAAGEGLRFLDTISGYNHYEQLLRLYQLNKDSSKQIDTPSLWKGEISIGQQSFSGEIRSWSQPYKLTLFSFKQDNNVSLEGNALGFSMEGMLHVLNTLEIINHRTDILFKYQNERRD